MHLHIHLIYPDKIRGTNAGLWTLWAHIYAVKVTAAAAAKEREQIIELSKSTHMFTLILNHKIVAYIKE